MTISPSDPFATPDHLRSPVRRLRGRLPAAVTLWTAPGPAGLTVSSTLVVEGEPGRLLGLLDEESDLWAAVEAAGRFAVTALTPEDRQLADRFAGLFPAPGGLFASGRRQPATVAGDGVRAGARRRRHLGRLPAGRRPAARLGPAGRGHHRAVELSEAEPPLVHHRGRYRELGNASEISDERCERCHWAHRRRRSAHVPPTPPFASSPPSIRFLPSGHRSASESHGTRRRPRFHPTRQGGDPADEHRDTGTTGWRGTQSCTSGP